MGRLLAIIALICATVPGCKEKALSSERGAPCSETQFCDQDKGLFCQVESSTCDCEGMFKWDDTQKLCAETETARKLREGEKKCRAGDQESCFMLGRLYLRGAHVARSDSTAVDYFRGACKSGLQKACDAMVVKRENMVCSVYLDCDRELGLFCDDEDNRCKCAAATVWDRSKARCEETKVARNLRVYREKCAAEDMEGCHLLAKLYTVGEGVAKDDAKARKLFQSACKNGYKPSCNFCMMMGGCEKDAGGQKTRGAP